MHHGTQNAIIYRALRKSSAEHEGADEPSRNARGVGTSATATIANKNETCILVVLDLWEKECKLSTSETVVRSGEDQLVWVKGNRYW